MNIKKALDCFLPGLAFLANVSCLGSKHTDQRESAIKSRELVIRNLDKWKNEGASFFDILGEDVLWPVVGKSPISGVYLGKNDFMENAVNPILKHLTTPLKPELMGLTADDAFVRLHIRAKANALNGGSYENMDVWKIQFKNEKIIAAVAFLDTYELSESMKITKKELTMDKTIEEAKGYVGMWVTKDGHIRQKLLPNNRYDEARGDRQSAYQGTYKVHGNHIAYVDDTGFSAEGEFVDEHTLHHGGYIFYKEE